MRNILVHYELQKVPDDLISYGLNLKKLVEYFFDGESFAKIDKKLDQKMIHISVILEKWLNYSIAESDLSQW